MTIDTGVDMGSPPTGVDRGAPTGLEAAPRRRGRRQPGPDGPFPGWWRWVGAAVVAAAVVVRFVARSQLWLDEALTVNIAQLPLAQIPDALRHDGSPPLYYVLLHGWMNVFGTGTWAVRAMSGVFAVATLPLAAWAGHRLGGRRVASAAVVLLAASPFAVLYATEARMYSLVMLLVLAGGLALAQLLERPSVPAALLLALLTGALVLTHYWCFFLVAAVGALLFIRALRGRQRRSALAGLAALAGGTLLFVPWLPVLLFQARHTGAPWGGPPKLTSVLDALWVFASGYRTASPLPFLLLVSLVALGVFGHARDRRHIEVDLKGREPGRTLAAVGFGALVLGIVTSRLTGDAYAHRYASIVLPVILSVAALGVAVLLDRRVRYAALGLAVTVGAVGIRPVIANERTQAPAVARALEAAAQPGDVVVYCPDQLGPSASRLLPPWLDQLTFPRALSPERVDWVDYAAVNRAARTAPFARMLIDRAGRSGDVWLVAVDGYATYGRKCSQLRDDLASFRAGQQVVTAKSRYPEKMGLTRFPAGAAPDPRPRSYRASD